MSGQIYNASNAIAIAIAPEVGLTEDVIEFVVFKLIPMLFNCHAASSDAAGRTPAEYLADHWDEETKTFDPSLIDRARNRTRRAARGNVPRHPTNAQLDAITVATFKHAMQATPEAVASCQAESSTIADV